MQKMDIKDTVDDMILQVCKFIKAADLSNKDDFEIKVESGLSILVSAIDMPEDINDIKSEEFDHIAKQIAKIITVVQYGLLRSTAEYCDENISEDRKIWF